MIFYFTIFNHRSEVASLDITPRLDQLKQKFTKFKNNDKENPDFQYEAFLSILFRIAIVFYDNSIDQQEQSSPKKLLSLLSRIELTKGFNEFVGL